MKTEYMLELQILESIESCRILALASTDAVMPAFDALPEALADELLATMKKARAQALVDQVTNRKPPAQEQCRLLVRQLVKTKDVAERASICQQLKTLRWTDKFCCPTCGSGVISAVGGSTRQCGDCGQQFTVPGH